MKKLLLLIFLLSSLASNAQMLINKKDAFTGKQLKGATVVLGRTMAPSGMVLVFAIDNGNKYISFTWTTRSGSFGAFNNKRTSDFSILFKMDDDSILKFKADTITSKILNAGNSSVLSVGSLITDDQLTTLMRHKVSIFRLGTKDDMGVDIDPALFTDRNRGQIQKAAAYMLDMEVIEDN